MINGIVAVERNQGIGFNGSMPWPHLRGDMAWFKKITTNHIVVMGSVTWESLGKPLPNRINIVVSRTKNFEAADHTFSNPNLIVDYCQKEYPDKEIFVIGGSAIYQHFMDDIGKFFVTEIEADYVCDRYFNLTYIKENFKTEIEHVKFFQPVEFTLKEYRR